MPKYYYIELWKCLNVPKWSNLKVFTCLPRLLRRGDEREELALCGQTCRFITIVAILSLELGCLAILTKTKFVYQNLKGHKIL